ncbi:MAG: hypothetical protein COA79_00070 [Planctomycetota bacterium]|nr:MAG: hypothetical protein COA79_00070 [Planctomycetota bacterium]
MSNVIGSSLVKLLKPLVKLLIQKSVPYGTFVEYVKWVYVNVAYEDFSDPLKKNSNSKIATLTGISRHDVKELLSSDSPDANESVFKHNKAARVISGWLNDQKYLDGSGKPKVLEIEGSELSFKSLIESYCGDIPPKPIMEELLRIGSVKVENEKVYLINEAYIPTNNDDLKIEFLGSDVSDLISTIHHNIENPGRFDFLQLKAMGDLLSKESKDYLRRKAKDDGIDFLRKVDHWLSQEELNTTLIDNEPTYRAGIGLYYFEEKNKEK